MLVPGVIFVSNRIDIITGLNIVPDFINQGFGFMSGGELAVDTEVPSGDNYTKGFRLNANGAVFGALAPAAVDVYIEGIPITSSGQIIFEVDDPTSFSSRNPITAAGNLAVT